MGLSTYQNPAMVFLKMMNPCSKGIEGLFNRPCGIGSGSCNECEIDDEAYQTLRLIPRIYTDILLGPKSIDPQQDEFIGFQYDPQQTARFNPTDPQGGYGVTPTIGGTWGDKSVGDYLPGNSLADVPYFYFGLINGGTAIDKLRKDYLVEK
jgi:hypothetical protein